MIRWALRSLAAERGRLLGTALGVAVAFTLVVFFEAVFEGESRKIIAYPLHAAADVWVMQDGVSNMHMATSLIWDWKQAAVEEVEGVEGREVGRRRHRPSHPRDVSGHLDPRAPGRLHSLTD